VDADAGKPAEVLADRDLELVAAAPDSVGDQLGLEEVDDTLGQGVVAGIADRADRDQHAVIDERLGVVGSAAKRETALSKRGAQGLYRCRSHPVEFLELGFGDLGQLIQARVAGA
jgi:hypothetical protein